MLVMCPNILNSNINSKFLIGFFHENTPFFRTRRCNACKYSIGQGEGKGKLDNARCTTVTAYILTERGGDMKVAEYQIGNGTVEIHDDNIVKTAEEREKILDRVGKIYSAYFSSREKEQTA